MKHLTRGGASWASGCRCASDERGTRGREAIGPLAHGARASGGAGAGRVGGVGGGRGRGDRGAVAPGTQHRLSVAAPLCARGGWPAWRMRREVDAADLHPRAGRRDRRGRLTDPQALGLPFESWTLDRLAAYLSEQKGIAMKRSRIDEVLQTEGLRWRNQETWFGERVDPDFAEKRGRSSALHSPARGQRRRLPRRDGAGGGQELPGQRLVAHRAEPQTPRRRRPAGGRGRRSTTAGAARATSSARSGRPPARPSPPPTPAAPSPTGSTSWSRSRRGCPAEVRAGLRDPRQPERPPGDRRAAVLPGPSALGVRLPAEVRRVPEPDRAVVEGAAVAGAEGRRFETWEEVCQAVERATAYWNAHRHPFVWGRRRRHRPSAAGHRLRPVSRDLPDAPLSGPSGKFVIGWGISERRCLMGKTGATARGDGRGAGGG